MTEPVDGMRVTIGISPVINLVQMVVYPVETVGTAQTIWKAQSVLRIAPGQTRVIVAAFRDDNGERVGAVNVTEPVAGTDYTINENSNGTGFDYTLTPSIDFDTTIEATRAIFTITSTALGPLYFTLLKIRGKPIRVWDPIVIEEVDATSQSTYEKRELVLDLAMQADTVFAQSYADYLIDRYKNPFMMVDQVTIQGRDEIVSQNIFSLELMDKVMIHDSHTGVDMLEHRIRGIEYEINAQTFGATLYLERSDDQRYWLLGVPKFGELGSVTWLGF